MALGSIVIDLLLKTGAFETDTKKAERRLKEMEKTAKQVGAAIGTAMVAVGSATAVMIRNAISNMDQLNKMAQQIGVATEELTGLRYAAEQMANVSDGQFDMALRRMTRRIEEAAAGGGPAADALKRMGLEARELVKLSPDEQFRKFADAIRNTATQGERLRNVMALMDTEGMPLVAMMQQGADAIAEVEQEAARLGKTVSQDAATAASEFESNLTRLRSGVSGLSMQVAGELLPDLVRLTDEFTRTATEGDKVSETAQNIADALRGIGAVVGVFVQTMKVVSGTVRGVMMDLIAMGHAADSGWKALRGDWSGAAAALRQMIVAREMAAEASDDIAKVFEESAPPDLSPVFAGEGAEPAGMFRRTAAEVAADRARKAAAEAAEAARKEAEARAAASAAAAEGAKQRAEAERQLAEAIREAEASERAMTLAMMESEQRKIDWLNRIDDMVARAEGPAAMAVLTFRRELAELNAALAVGDISMQDYQRAAQALGQTLGDVVAEVDTATGEMTVFAEQAARNIQSFLGDATYDLLDGKFRDIADSFSDMIKRMLAELAASKLLDMLAQIGANNSGTWWGSILSGLSGTRANGGNVASGGTYLVGERGPELLRMGPNSGTIVPNHALGGGGGVRVQVINNGPPVQAQASSETQPDGTQLVRLVLNEVASDIASGGVVARAGKSRFGWKEQV